VNTRVQMASAWCAIIFMVVFALGFWVLAGFIPPPSPALSPAQITRQFQGNTTGIRVGMLLMEFGAALLLPWGGAIAVQMKRIEGRHTVLTYTRIMAGSLFVLEFIYPIMFWLVAAFRPHQSSLVLQHFNDLAWLTFLGVVTTAIVQVFVIGIITMRDKRPKPVFPRWFAYFNFWCGTLFCPASLIVFFHHGAFAWNGFVSWWMVAVVFFTWMLVMTIMLMRAIRHQEAEEAAGEFLIPGDLTPDIAGLRAEVAALRAEVTALRAERSPAR
jgi:hypothetical protein